MFLNQAGWTKYVLNPCEPQCESLKPPLGESKNHYPTETTQANRNAWYPLEQTNLWKILRMWCYFDIIYRPECYIEQTFCNDTNCNKMWSPSMVLKTLTWWPWWQPSAEQIDLPQLHHNDIPSHRKHHLLQNWCRLLERERKDSYWKQN